MTKAEQKLRELMNNDKCGVFLVDAGSGKLLKFDASQGRKACESNVGIVGEALKTGCQIITPRPNMDPVYNNMVDLDTELSLITIPVRSEEFKRTIAILQMIDLHASISNSLGKSSSFETEILNFFIQIFTICIENTLKIQKKLEEIAARESGSEDRMKNPERMAEKIN